MYISSSCSSNFLSLWWRSGGFGAGLWAWAVGFGNGLGLGGLGMGLGHWDGYTWSRLEKGDAPSKFPFLLLLLSLHL